MAGPHRRKILIVDDDPSVRQLVRLILEVNDFEVVGEAPDGVEAVPQAVALQPDFIVLDGEMPHRGGAEAARMIRSRCPDSVIIAFSAVIDRKPVWADAFLEKHHVSDLALLMEGLVQLRN